eukprot:sb/3472904/
MWKLHQSPRNKMLTCQQIWEIHSSAYRLFKKIRFEHNKLCCSWGCVLMRTRDTAAHLSQQHRESCPGRKRLGESGNPAPLSVTIVHHDATESHRPRRPFTLLTDLAVASKLRRDTNALNTDLPFWWRRPNLRIKTGYGAAARHCQTDHLCPSAHSPCIK